MALRRAILMKADPMVSLHAHRLFSGRTCSCRKAPCCQGVLPEKLGGGVRTLPETLTLLQTKICDFPYPILDLIKNVIPNFRPEAQGCYGRYHR